MSSIKEKTLRLLIAVVFAILVFLPLALVCSELTVIAGQKYEYQVKLLEHALKEQVDSFRESLIPRLYLQNILKAGEAHIGLTSETLKRPIFERGVDPKLITATTRTQLLDFYKDYAGIEPLLLVSFNADFASLWSWFSPDMNALTAQARNEIENALALYTANLASFTPVVENDPDTFQRFYRMFPSAYARFENGQGAGNLKKIHHRLFADYFSEMAYSPPHHQGICFEIVTTMYGSRRIFTYHRAVSSRHEQIYGGYFVVFAGKQIRISDMLANTLKWQSPGFVRHLLTSTSLPLNQIVHNSDELIMAVHVPTELAGYNSLASQPQRLPGYLSVSASLHDSNVNFRRSLQQLSFLQKFTTLAVFCGATYFILFGFPLFFRLRARMLAVITLVMLLPYAILGFFCFGLLDSIGSLGEHELESEADGLMYRLHNYFDDQKLQFILHMLKSKLRMMKVVDAPAAEIMRLRASEIVSDESETNLSFFRNDGVTRTFRDRGSPNTEVGKIDNLLSAKYLGNLGELESTNAEVKKIQQHSQLADGFFESFRQNYYEHSILSNEGIETRDIRKIDSFSRMIYYLIPSRLAKGISRVRALAMNGSSSTGYLLVRPGEFSPQIYSETSDLGEHEFALAQRRPDDSILRWWPEYINPDAELRNLLDIASLRRQSGFLKKADAKGFKFSQYRYFQDKPAVFAGTSRHITDHLLQFTIRVFPVLLLLIAIVSLLLFAEILAALFVSPVKGFHQAARLVSTGNFAVSVKLEKTDEFSLLADSFNRMTLGLQQREKMRRFVSEDLYEQLGKKTFTAVPRVSQLTLLASDIRGFTALSEKHEPQQIVSLLNDYFTEMESAITSCGGFIERLVGDAVVAVFYPVPDRSSEEMAVQAAIGMRSRLAELNRDRIARGLFPIDNGIGIATGTAFSGMAGA
ncbi:MAG: adenylate cyclase, partial [uncultured bacterium]